MHEPCKWEFLFVVRLNTPTYTVWRVLSWLTVLSLQTYIENASFQFAVLLKNADVGREGSYVPTGIKSYRQYEMKLKCLPIRPANTLQYQKMEFIMSLPFFFFYCD